MYKRNYKIEKSEKMENLKNPYFTVDLDNEVIKDGYNQYTIDEFKAIFERSSEPLGMSVKTEKLISLNFNMEKLQDYYAGDEDNFWY